MLLDIQNYFKKHYFQWDQYSGDILSSTVRNLRGLLVMFHRTLSCTFLSAERIVTFFLFC